MVLLIPDKIDFMTKVLQRKEGDLIIIKGQFIRNT